MADTEKIVKVAVENSTSAGTATEASAVNTMSGAEHASDTVNAPEGERSGDMKEDLLTFQGFRFSALADARMAEEEYKKMVYIRGRMNMDNSEEVLAIYHKMIENGLFVTPVGVDFLMRIREYLIGPGGIDPSRIRPIETGSLFTQRARNEARAESRPRVTTDLVAENKKLKQKYFISLAFAIICVCLVIAMFVVARSSDNPNILNYKNAIENQYAEWEESLTQREKELREKEEALNNGEDQGTDSGR